MKKLNTIKKIFIIFLFTFIFDLAISQFFLLDIVYKTKVKAHKEDFENRIFNRNYKYTLKPKKTFTALYSDFTYLVHTNNLGFRDSEIREIDHFKNYSIIVGDSFVEGIGVSYKDTIVGNLNNKLGEQFQLFEFLNAGVTSYESYIYYKKIITILEENPWLNINSVILLSDKSDIANSFHYYCKEAIVSCREIEPPEVFINTKGKYQNKRRENFKKDLIEFNFWRFYRKQTIVGMFLHHVGDQIDLLRRHIRDKFRLSKKLDKSFFEISKNHTNALRSINNFRTITNYLHGEQWEQQGKISLEFSIQNFLKLKDYLDKKNIDLIVVLYPYARELVEPTIRNNYLDFMEDLLVKNNIQYINLYNLFLSGDVYLNISKNFFFNDIHYNANGNKLIADALFDKLN